MCNEYVKKYNIELSRCYTEYGLKRTGCFGCPYSKDYKYELEILKKYEPTKYNATLNMFSDVYKFKEKENR